MDISIFIAKVLGPYMIIMAIAMSLNAKRVKALLTDKANVSFMLVSGMLAVVFGLMIVVTHNLWEANWKVIITVIGWLALIKGIVRLFFPEHTMKSISNMIRKKKAFHVTAFVILLIGAYLSYMAYIG